MGVEPDVGSGAEVDEALLALVYEQLHRIAAAKLRHEHGRGSLQTTDLVHEAWLHLCDQEKLDWGNKDQFACLAARAIRRILIDRARARSAQKRVAPGERVTLSEDLRVPHGAALDLVALDQALGRLAQSYGRAARVVELRFFGGMTESETARALTLSERTVASDWAFARAWLRRALEGGAA